MDPSPRSSRPTTFASLVYQQEKSLHEYRTAQLKRKGAEGVVDPNVERDPVMPSDEFEMNLKEVSKINEEILAAAQADDSITHYQWGAIMALFCGNAIGASFGRRRQLQQDQDMIDCLELTNSGNPLFLAPGQISHNAELAMSLIWAILRRNDLPKAETEFAVEDLDEQKSNPALDGKILLNQEAYAYYYQKWFNSKPFTLDFAVSASIGRLEETALAKLAIEGAQNVKGNCRSNESLARIVPLAVWASRLNNKNDFAQAILSDVQMTHADHPTAQAIFMYCKVVKFLLDNHAKKNKIALAWSLVVNESHIPMVDEYEKEEMEIVCTWMQMAGELAYRFNNNKSCQGRLKQEALVDEKVLDGKYSIIRGDPNYVKVSYVLALYWLQRAEYSLAAGISPLDFFQHAMTQTMKQGGEADTNCMIVGAMLGAALGISAIPENLINGVLSADCTGDMVYNRRPDFLNTSKHLATIIEQLLKTMPVGESKTESVLHVYRKD